MWCEWVVGLNLSIIIHGNDPYFQREISQSFIDLTTASAAAAPFWYVSDEETLSLHKYFMVDSSSTPGRTNKRENWKVEKLALGALGDELLNRLGPGNILFTAEDL